MRTRDLLVIAVWAIAGCSSDGSETTDAATTDAATNDEPESHQLLRQWITAYDREIAASCPCLVEAGDFPSADECMAAIGSGPTWMECVIEAVEGFDASVPFTDARCMIESRVTRAECHEEADCDPEAVLACSSLTFDCPPFDTDLIVHVLEECPDTALLSR